MGCSFSAKPSIRSGMKWKPIERERAWKGEKEKRRREQGKHLHFAIRYNFYTLSKSVKRLRGQPARWIACTCVWERGDDGRWRRRKNVPLLCGTQEARGRERERDTGSVLLKSIKWEERKNKQKREDTDWIRICGRKNGGTTRRLRVTTLDDHHPPQLTTKVSPQELSLDSPNRCLAEGF